MWHCVCAPFADESNASWLLKMTNKRESWNKVIYQKVTLHNCGFLQCCVQVSLFFVLALCTLWNARHSFLYSALWKLFSCYLHQSAADRHVAMSSWQPMSLSLSPPCQSVHISILFFDIYPPLCWQPIKYCHSVTLLLSFGGSGNKITLLPS